MPIKPTKPEFILPKKYTDEEKVNLENEYTQKCSELDEEYNVQL